MDDTGPKRLTRADLDEIDYLDKIDDEVFVQIPEKVQKSLSVNNAVFHHLHLIAWQVNLHSAVIWGDSTMRPAVYRVLRKYADRVDLNDRNQGPLYKFVVVKVKKSLRELLHIEPTELLIIVENADEFAHEIRKFCDDWDALFRFTLTRVLLLSSVDVDLDIDKKTLVENWLVKQPESTMGHFDFAICHMKRCREKYIEATAELNRVRELYLQSKKNVQDAMDSEEL
jgi:hypothetical protein